MVGAKPPSPNAAVSSAQLPVEDAAKAMKVKADAKAAVLALKKTLNDNDNVLEVVKAISKDKEAAAKVEEVKKVAE